MERMVPIVRPGRVESISAYIAAANQTRVVGVRFGDQQHRPMKRRGQRIDLAGQLLEYVLWGLVNDRVHRVQAQAVDVVLANPHQRVVDDEATDLVAAGAVEIERGSPCGAVAIGEVRAELVQEIAQRACMVVHDVQNDSETRGVTLVDELFETRGTAVGMMGSEEIHAVIAPPTIARELGDRHKLDDVDAEVDEVGEPLDHSVEGSFGREGSDVQLIKDEAREGEAAPARVSPRVPAVLDHLRQAQHAIGLRRRARVGPGLSTLDRKAVARTWTGGRIGDLLPSETRSTCCLPGAHTLNACIALTTVRAAAQALSPGIGPSVRRPECQVRLAVPRR